MQEYQKPEETRKTMKKAPSLNSSGSIHKCIDQVFRKNKYRGKYVKITIEKKKKLQDWLTKNPQPASDDFISISRTINEPLESVEKWYKNQKKTNKEIKKGGISKTKRILSKEEEEILEKAFRTNIKPKPEKYKELAKKVSINSKQIRKWFKYRRRKLKKLYSEGVAMPSSQIKGKTIDSSESSYKTSNSSPNISTNDLKSQPNNSSSDSNQMRLKEQIANNQQENMSSQKKEPENQNIPVNSKQQPMNLSTNYGNLYQNSNNAAMGQNYPQMFVSYPFVQNSLDTSSQQTTVPIIPQNNLYRIIQNSTPSIIYLPTNQTPFYINNNGFQQSPLLIKNLPNVPNYAVNQPQPQFVVMNNRNNGSEMMKPMSEGFESIGTEKAQAYCFLNHNKPVQISNNNQHLFNNIIYVKQNNDCSCPGYINNPNMMPNVNLIQNLQIMQPQNQAYCVNPNGYQHLQNIPNGAFLNNGVYQFNAFNNQNLENKRNSAGAANEMMKSFTEDFKKMEEN